MYIPSFEEIKDIDDSRYKLSLMVAQRARQLAEGAESYVDTEDKNYVTIALEEIVKGYIVIDEE